MDGSVTLTLILVWIIYRMMIRTGRDIYILGVLKGPWSTVISISPTYKFTLSSSLSMSIRI